MSITTRLGVGAVLALTLTVPPAMSADASTSMHPKPGPVARELVSFAAKECVTGCGSGSTIGPDGALYVTDGRAGAVFASTRRQERRRSSPAGYLRLRRTSAARWTSPSSAARPMCWSAWLAPSSGIPASSMASTGSNATVGPHRSPTSVPGRRPIHQRPTSSFPPGCSTRCSAMATVSPSPTGTTTGYCASGSMAPSANWPPSRTSSRPGSIVQGPPSIWPRPVRFRTSRRPARSWLSAPRRGSGRSRWLRAHLSSWTSRSAPTAPSMACPRGAGTGQTCPRTPGCRRHGTQAHWSRPPAAASRTVLGGIDQPTSFELVDDTAFVVTFTGTVVRIDNV